MQHSFAQVPHGAWHHHQLGRHRDLHHSFYKLCVAWEGHWALLIKAPLNSKANSKMRTTQVTFKTLNLPATWVTSKPVLRLCAPVSPLLCWNPVSRAL